MAYRYRRSYRSYDSKKAIDAKWNPDIDAYKVKFPYNENFIELIKKSVPDSEREYDAFEKKWTIATKYFEDMLLPAAKILWPTADFTIIDRKEVEKFNQGQRNAPQVIAPEVLAEKFYQMLEKAGLSVDRKSSEFARIRKIYLKAAMYYHPDRNKGDGVQMSELNYLWQSLTNVENGAYFK